LVFLLLGFMVSGLLVEAFALGMAFASMRPSGILATSSAANARVKSSTRVCPRPQAAVAHDAGPLRPVGEGRVVRDQHQGEPAFALSLRV
jgi:hypothetical protein